MNTHRLLNIGKNIEGAKRFSSIIWVYSICIVFALAAFLRVNNLNYNSIYSDEAIYVVLGKLGRGAGDWYSYNPKAWVGGLVYAYPSLAAIANSVSLLLPRLLNVVMGLMLLVVLWWWISPRNLWGGLVALWMAGMSGVFLFTSRLATYDMPSMLAVVTSMAIFSRGVQKSEDTFELRRKLILSAVLIISAVAFKWTALLYLLLMMMWVFVLTVKNKKISNSLRIYWLIPVMIGVGVLVLADGGGFATYSRSQIVLQKESVWTILGNWWELIGLSAAAAVIGWGGLWLRKERILATILLIGMLAPLVFHVYFGRLTTLDKHSAYSVLFASAMFGFGIKEWIPKVGVKKVVALVGLLIFMQIYGLMEMSKWRSLESSWPNSTGSDNYLKQNIVPGNKVLSESGPSAILAVYQKINPTDVTTFDWVASYQRYEGNRAYQEAVRDGYYHFIQIRNGGLFGSQSREELHNLIKNSTENNYKKVYEDEGYSVYQRIY